EYCAQCATGAGAGSGEIILRTRTRSTDLTRRDYDPSLPELAHDPDQIEQVLLNIVRNALQALGPEGGEIILRTRTAFQLTLHGE
ncbi:hypothetical protein LVK61_29450, partial [Escherichia coli]|nr:hypothetical protein [Escherichia coli]